ncbi:uncharacterized protein PRCAT00005744001 [Priceomyces carsonii]|uniref:uncharacterized protein n=1 Tax=Priceomyces carsonii TaxID=28549 RepID=UPI002EDB6AE2|nr:unnamed protein product [Priceomyces carsonii]
MDSINRRIKSLNRFLPQTNPWLILMASVPVALATGTLFVYSVYATQLAEKCHLDTSQTANLNISSTIGTAVGGIMSGLIADAYGSQIPMLFSCFSLTLGYNWLYHLFELGSLANLLALESAMFFVGFGSSSGYFSSLKAVTVSFPEFKGSAQSITIASFAISSLIFLNIATRIFKGDVAGFLFFLSIISGVTTMTGFVFVRFNGHLDETGEHLSLIEEAREELEIINSSSRNDLRNMDINGSVCHPIFWYHYFIFTFIQGFGQMYIYSIGFILKAINRYYSDEFDALSLGGLQALHVSLIAVSSFAGRLSAGPLSDFFVRKLKCQRHWILILGVSIMFVGHFLILRSINKTAGNLHEANTYLLISSVLIGYAYGFSFTGFPAIISDIFNMKNYSFIWGLMYSSTIFGLTLMTKLFGIVYDSNSGEHDGEYVCTKGSECYNYTFKITSYLCLFVIILLLGYIWKHSLAHHR